MRRRHDYTDLWGGLRDVGRHAGDGPRRPRRASSLPPEARDRLFDAALGVLASIRTVVDVVEEVLEERRGRPDDDGERGPWVRDPGDVPSRRPEPAEEEGNVRDIPFTGP
jgi:hypothetical protein